MYFSEIIGQIGKGNYIFDKKNQVILEIVEGKIKIQFYPENAKVICNSEEVEVSLEQFSDFTFEKRESEVDGEENQVALLFNNDEILVCTESKSSTIQTLFELLSDLFDDNVICSPKYQVEKLINKFSIDCDKKFNPIIWKLLLQYKKKIEMAFEEGDFKPNSKIITLLEEESGEIASNLGETAKKGFSNLVKNFNGLGSLVQAGIGIAKAAGTRIAKGMVNNLFSEKNIMLLTNQNVGKQSLSDVQLVAYDSNGNVVDVEIVPESLEAEVEISSPQKTVPVKIETEGELDGKAIKSLAPSVKEVTLYGSQEVLDNIEYLPVSIDISGIDSDKNYTVNLTNPTGVREISVKTINVKLVVAEVVSTEIGNVKININNLEDGYAVQALDESYSSVTVIVKGSQDVIDSLDASTIYASIDLAGLQAGQHEVDVKVSGDDNRLSYTSRIKKVKVLITEK